MKKLWIIAVPLILGLWAGYALGYRQGSKDEEQAWSATAETATVEGQLQRPWHYQNPHVRAVYTSLHPNAVNVPDPRVYKQYSGSSQ